MERKILRLHGDRTGTKRAPLLFLRYDYYQKKPSTLIPPLLSYMDKGFLFGLASTFRAFHLRPYNFPELQSSRVAFLSCSSSLLDGTTRHLASAIAIGLNLIKYAKNIKAYSLDPEKIIARSSNFCERYHANYWYL